MMVATFLGSISRHIPQDDDGALFCTFDCGEGNDIKIQHTRFRITDLNLVTTELGPFAGIQIEDPIPVNFPQVSAHGFSEGSGRIKPDQLPCGSIGISDSPFAVQYHHALLNGLENGLQ